MSAEDDVDTVARLRTPPHSLEAEQAVLGALMLDNDAWDRVWDLVVAKDFYRHEHRLILEAISGLINSNRPADQVTVAESLQRAGKADEAGGMSYLGALVESVASAANARRYAEIVRERSVQRQLIATLDEAVGNVFAQRGTASEQIDATATALAALERAGNTQRGPRALGEILVQRIDRLNAVYEGAEEPGISTGFGWLDLRLGGGLVPGHVYILAARPSVGKSSLAEAIGTSIASRHGHPVLFLSQEMPDTEIGDRAIAEIGGVDYHNVRSGKLIDGDWGKATEAVEIGSKIPFYVDDQPGLTLREIRRKARSVKGLRVLVLDYLQLCEAEEGSRRSDTRSNEIGSISRGLKKLAKQLGIAVLALSQLNREVEKRPGREPTMADLRDSGEIEQDADVIIFLWPLRDYPTGDAKLVGKKLAKNRQGPLGEIALEFRGRYQRWAQSDEPVRPAASKATGDFQ